MLSSLFTKHILTPILLNFYMISYEIQVRIYTHYCYLQAYEIFSDLEVELYDYVHIFMHIAKFFRF